MNISLCEMAAACMPRNKHRKTNPQKTGNPIERFSGKIHIIWYDLDDRNCYVCGKPTSRKRTNFICTGCSHKPHLHPKDCFVIYHTNN